MCELKPCPICGSEVHISASSDGYGVECASDGCFALAMDRFLTPELAAQYWNTRSGRYMELPVDADGVPVRPRDEVSTGMGDDGPIGHLEYWYPNHWVAVIEYKPGQFTRYDPAVLRHVKPRTLEDVLREYRHDASVIYDDPNLGGEDRADALKGLDEKVAAEIRELMEVGE